MNKPSSLRLSGRNAMPAAIASAGERMRRALPSTAIVPPSIGSAPAIARASSVRPLPTRPARPTISPARICSEMSLSTPLRLQAGDLQDAPVRSSPAACRSAPPPRRHRTSRRRGSPRFPSPRARSARGAHCVAPSRCRRARAPRRGSGSRRRLSCRSRAECGSSGGASRSRRWSATRSARPSRSPAPRTRPRAGSRPSACRRCATRRPWRCPSSSKPHCEMSFAYCVRIRRRCTSPERRGSMPRKTFSITLICGTGESSCAIVAIPSMRASRGLA